MNPIRLVRLLEEARRIGPRAFVFRVRHELVKKANLDLRKHPIREIEVAQPPPHWRERLVLPAFDVAAHRQWMETHLDEDARAEVVRLGRDAAAGVILAFRAWPAQFGSLPDWTLNPANGAHWPADHHGQRVLNAASRQAVGDIKLTWELGRFLHLGDLLRAYILTGDVALIDALFAQLADFRAKNHVNQGPHWISEQEVGIRNAMLAVTLMVLRDDPALTDERAALLLSVIEAGAWFCHDHIELARRCIANNHYIAGIMGLLLPALIAPWLHDAAHLADAGRKHLHEALDTQWGEDGGYVQPSHNYHRLALNYLLWLRRFADGANAGQLIADIDRRLAQPLRLLHAMMAEDGRLPNWGPNDGAQFWACTSCDYADFRPVLTALHQALHGTRLFDGGPWDEQLLWQFGDIASEIAPRDQPAQAGFPHAGLHLLRQGKQCAILRSGPIHSRYGQHSDQLHLDLWVGAANRLADAGSYDYADRELHEWFRGVHSHNTLRLHGQSQMLPYRQFLFLKWPRTKAFQLGAPPNGVRAWVGGAHDGYRRLPGRANHGRVLMALDNGVWAVLDLVHATRPQGDIPFTQLWHGQPDAPAFVIDEPFVGHFPGKDGSLYVRWAGTTALEPSTLRGEDGQSWSARTYGRKQPAPALHLNGAFYDRLVLCTLWCAGRIPERGLACETQTCRIGDDAIDLAPIWRQLRNL